MWIAQTYLKSPEPEAKLHVYYLFRNWIAADKEATDYIREHFKRLSDIHQSDVCFLLPELDSVNRIDRQIRDTDRLWCSLAFRTPGFLLSRKPLELLTRNDDELFFIPAFNHTRSYEDHAGSLRRLDLNVLVARLEKLQELISYDIEWQQRHLNDWQPGHSWSGWDAVEMKPGFFGFRIDLKKLFFS